MYVPLDTINAPFNFGAPHADMVCIFLPPPSLPLIPTYQRRANSYSAWYTIGPTQPALKGNQTKCLYLA